MIAINQALADGQNKISTPVVSPSINRISSIGLLRGIVMIIMALDHVRDFFPADAFFYNPSDLSQTTPAVFFTRCITLFVPLFLFFLPALQRSYHPIKKQKSN